MIQFQFPLPNYNLMQSFDKKEKKILEKIDSYFYALSRDRFIAKICWHLTGFIENEREQQVCKRPALFVFHLSCYNALPVSTIVEFKVCRETISFDCSANFWTCPCRMEMFNSIFSWIFIHIRDGMFLKCMLIERWENGVKYTNENCWKRGM